MPYLGWRRFGGIAPTGVYGRRHDGGSWETVRSFFEVWCVRLSLHRGELTFVWEGIRVATSPSLWGSGHQTRVFSHIIAARILWVVIYIDMFFGYHCFQNIFTIFDIVPKVPTSTFWFLTSQIPPLSLSASIPSWEGQIIVEVQNKTNNANTINSSTMNKTRFSSRVFQAVRSWKLSVLSS